MLILGLSALRHDPAAVLLSENGIEAAIEESKLVRARNVGGIPRKAIEFCLEGIDWHDVACVALASRPLRAWARNAWLRCKMAPIAPVATAYYHTKNLGELSAQLNNLRILRLLNRNPASRLITLDHHLCHASSAFYASPFDRALIMVLDEQGDGSSGLVAVAEGTRIRILRRIPFPHSLAWVYSQVTDLLGFVPHLEEHKTQWLSLEGEPTFQDLFLDLFGYASGSQPHLNASYFTPGLSGRLAFSEKFYRRLGLVPGEAFEPDEEIRRQLASSLQRACATVITGMAEWWRCATAAQNLCLAGGMFLNPLLVAALEQNNAFENVFVQPAAGNEGSALGAAWLVWHQILGQPRLRPLSSLYFGPSYTPGEIKQLLDNCKVHYTWRDSETQQIEETVKLLEGGAIVAWFQGAAEFGPRALGNRSVLASPWTPYLKENLNEYVKHREPFRPFALAVPEEDCSRYFDCSQAPRFMTSLGWVRPDRRHLVTHLLLSGGAVRLHAVDRETNPLFWRLLKRFGERAPAPMLVNTSFNLFGEPLVITPRDAVRSLFCSGIDALAIDRFLVTKSWEVRLASESDQLQFQGRSG